MISETETVDIIKRIKQNLPSILFRDISAMDRGMLSILMYLDNYGEGAYANTMASHLQISKARVAVLLQKLEKRGLIAKSKSPKDARIEIVTMTLDGKKELNNINQMIQSTTQRVLEKIGKEDVEEFIRILGAIKKVMDNK